MFKRIPHTVYILQLAATAAAAAGGDSLPQEWPKDRYERLAAQSPFALATAPSKTTGATAPFAADLFVTGLGKIGDTDCVFIASRDQQKRYALVAGESGADGMMLTAVEWSDQVGKSKVTIQKDGETAVLEFDQAVLQAPVAGVPAPVVPPPQPVPNAVIRPVNPTTLQQKTSSGETRRRIRMIPSRPQK